MRLHIRTWLNYALLVWNALLQKMKLMPSRGTRKTPSALILHRSDIFCFSSGRACPSNHTHHEKDREVKHFSVLYDQTCDNFYRSLIVWLREELALHFGRLPWPTFLTTRSRPILHFPSLSLYRICKVVDVWCHKLRQVRPMSSTIKRGKWIP